MIHKILQVFPTDDYKVYLYFSDGKVKLFDGTALVKNGVFQSLQDESKFKNLCTVLNDTLAWDISGNYDPSNCLDLDPQELYNSCPEVIEPIDFL